MYFFATISRNLRSSDSELDSEDLLIDELNWAWWFLVIR